MPRKRKNRQQRAAEAFDAIVNQTPDRGTEAVRRATTRYAERVIARSRYETVVAQVTEEDWPDETGRFVTHRRVPKPNAKYPCGWRFCGFEGSVDAVKKHRVQAHG